MNILLFDEPACTLALRPFTYLRPLGEIRVGILTLAEKWEQRLGHAVSYHTAPYLREKYPAHITAANLLVHGGLCIDDAFYAAALELSIGTGLYHQGELLAACIESFSADEPSLQERVRKKVEYKGPVRLLKAPHHIFLLNKEELLSDIVSCTRHAKRYRSSSHDRSSLDPSSLRGKGAHQLYFASEIDVDESVLLNLEEGPIYIGDGAKIEEGVILQGPCAVGAHSCVQAGARVRGHTAIGPYCKIGGEVVCTVFLGYANKAHEGFIGHSVIGEWCNLGAGTSCSNLKNTYGSVKQWNAAKADFVDTGEQFCGLMMGDHSKCGIQSMFNTGTVTGISSNIFGAGFPPQYIPSFSWGGAATGLETFSLEKAEAVASAVMERRSCVFGEADRRIFRHVFQLTAQERNINPDHRP